MKISYAGGQFIATISFEQRLAFQRTGWVWDKEILSWTTRDPGKASNFEVFADATAAQALDVWRGSLNGSLALSYATTAGIVIPAPAGLDYDQFQKAGILYATMRANTLIADEMGLGKTVQAIGFANYFFWIKRVLIVPPAGGKINWLREWTKWDVKRLSIGIAGTRSHKVRESDPVILNKRTGEPQKMFTERQWPGTDVVVCNYEMLGAFEQEVRAKTWDLLILDEAQYLTNATTVRARNVIGCTASKKKNRNKLLPIPARRRIFLSGTPMMTAPKDIWTLCEQCDPNGLGKNWKSFVYRYCAAHSSGFGLDTSGASNLEELQAKLRTAFMVRRLKADVLTQLPPKRRQLIPLPADGLAKLVGREQDAGARLRAALADYEASLRPLEPEAPALPETPWPGLEAAIFERFGALDAMSYQERAATLSPPGMLAFEEMSTARKELAEAKVPMVIEHVENALSSGGKIILFVVHTEMAERLRTHFPTCAFITGKVPPMKRQAQVDRFQDDPTCQLMIGNIQAAGVLYTMTASSHVIFAELDWVPSALAQAEDRAHRRGQTDSVLVQHLVVDGSMDARFVEVVLAREETLSAALDRRDDSRPVA